MNTTKQGINRPRKAHVRLTELTTDPDTFQFREQEVDPRHVDELVDVLKAGKELDPMVAWKRDIDGRLIVIDGHHRLAALLKAGANGKVRIEVHTCSREDARLLALNENAKARLQMSPAEKASAAWRLVCDESGYSKAQIAKATGVSTSTVANMRNVRKQLEVSNEEIPLNWVQARVLARAKGHQPIELTEDEREELIKARAKALDDKVGKLIGDMGERQLEAVRLMLEWRLGQKTTFLADYWRGAGGEDDDLPF